MTRINVVPVESLHTKHLVAEYRELPRIFALAHKASMSSKPWTNKQPKSYTLGTGHVLFFYDKLQWLSDRHKELVQEMLNRGYNPAFTGCLKQEWQGRIPQGYWKHWEPDNQAVEINQQRINERLEGMK